jgi:tetratricopeptide (TPR) repeat protein
MVLVFGYFTYREIRDYFLRSYRLLNKAIKFYENGLYAQALPYAEKALEKYEKRIDVDPQEMINFLEVLANVHWQLENHEKAKQMFQRSLEISEDLWGRDSLKAAEHSFPGWIVQIQLWSSGLSRSLRPRYGQLFWKVMPPRL